MIPTSSPDLNADDVQAVVEVRCPGEKLFEELFLEDEEYHRPTHALYATSK